MFDCPTRKNTLTVFSSAVARREKARIAKKDSERRMGRMFMRRERKGKWKVFAKGTLKRSGFQIAGWGGVKMGTARQQNGLGD